jgi:hypothetical protein
MKKYQWLGIIGGSVLAVSASAQTMIESFEYANNDELLGAWVASGNTVLSLTNSVAARASGTNALRAEFSFPSTPWATETLRGPVLAIPLVIAPTQYLTLRLQGDAAFAPSDFHNLYLYAYDVNGNFGRWGTATPTTDTWQILNFQASSIEQPWDSPGLPDLSQIVQFAFFQYGSQAALDPYTATIYLDELMVRDRPLTEFPLPSAPRELIDDFEGYADNAALSTFYSYQNSPSATVTTASLQMPAPQGNQALKLAIDFAAGQWPWGSVRSATVQPFSLPTNAVVSMRIKGDPALAGVADSGTVLWLSFYDQTGRGINYITAPDPVISTEWTTLQAHLADFGDTSTVDIGNITQWRILVEGWMGTADSAALSASVYVDDIRITVPPPEQPILSLGPDGAGFKLTMDHLTVGANYELRSSPDCAQWSLVTATNASSTTATWLIPNNQPKAFFRLVQQ